MTRIGFILTHIDDELDAEIKAAIERARSRGTRVVDTPIYLPYKDGKPLHGSFRAVVDVRDYNEALGEQVDVKAGRACIYNGGYVLPYCGSRSTESVKMLSTYYIENYATLDPDVMCVDCVEVFWS